MTTPHETSHDHHHGSRDRHGNPEDVDDYIAKMEDPARDQWQKPDEVLGVLALGEGAVTCDIGAGPGYFALRMAGAVGRRGHGFAVDVDPRILDTLRQRLVTARISNLTPVLGLGGDPLLPPTSCDLILVVDTFHHFPDGVAYLRRLVEALRPGGRIVNIDFHKRELPVGPPLDHKVAREDFLVQANRAGLEVIDEPTFLPYQYFMVMHPKT